MIDSVDDRETGLERRGNLWLGRFVAMAGPCEVQLELKDSMLAAELLDICAEETWRIEAKFSRYRPDNVMAELNAGAGKAWRADEETAKLLDFAARCHELSGGLFDVTAGVLRRAWRFDGSDHLPSRAEVKALLPLVGWEQVAWHSPILQLAQGMEIDLGGIGKEYAVDRCIDLLSGRTQAPCLVNFGGDLRVSGPRRDGGAWRVVIENPQPGEAERELELKQGALATSGDARRFLERRGVRYSHILNPRTGWPVPGAPSSVSVAAGSCLEAGLFATLALLHGRRAAAFLDAQGLDYWM